MNETFGIAQDRYSATDEQKKQIADKKKEILNLAKGLTLDEALENEVLQKYISDAWLSPQSREAMIERKMRNNAIKKIPKDFGNGMIETLFEESAEDFYRYENKNIPALPENEPKKKDARLEKLNMELKPSYDKSAEDIIDE